MKSQSALFGIMITAGTAIGAGMFSLPVVSSGMWFLFSLICLFYLWLLNYLSSLYVLEANVQFKPGASFDTITTEILGKRWNFFIGLSIGFLLYILLYAYFSAFGNIVSQSLGWKALADNQWMQGSTSLLLGALLASGVWYSTKMVGRLSTFLVMAMVVSFILSMGGFAFQIEMNNLLDLNGQKNSSYFPYLWAALPYYMTSFGFVTVVPSLYKLYGAKPALIKKCLFTGSFLALAVYALFILVTFGNISREDFITINEAGGNIGHLVNAFEKDGNGTAGSFILNLFSNFAIVSSFLGVGLSLFDYIADKLSFEDNKYGRFKTACITFLPYGIASFFFPNGFIAAIGFAGLVVIFGFFIAPYFMVKRIRSNSSDYIYRVSGGNGLLLLFLASALLVGICHILAMLNYLPQW